MTDSLNHLKTLQTQGPFFRGEREKYNDFRHLLLNHLKPHRHKLSEEQKLTYFQSLLRDDTIEFWQSLKITKQTTLAQVLRDFKQEYAKEDLQDVAKYKFEKMHYNPSADTFNDLLNKFKKVAIQAFADKSLRHSCLQNSPFNCRMSWHLQTRLTPQWRKYEELCRGDASTQNCNQLFQKPSPLTKSAHLNQRIWCQRIPIPKHNRTEKSK